MAKTAKVLILAFLIFSPKLWGQAYPRYGSDNEIKLNLGLFLVTTSFEVSYEYYFAEDISIGGTIYFDGKTTDFNGGFGIGPNIRAYFGYLPRSGFYVEAFGLYYTGEHELDENSSNARKIDYSTGAVGLGVGNKWVTRSQRFSLEIGAGLGRNINPEDFQDAFMFRASVSLGYRF